MLHIATVKMRYMKLGAVLGMAMASHGEYQFESYYAAIRACCEPAKCVSPQKRGSKPQLPGGDPPQPVPELAKSSVSELYVCLQKMEAICAKKKSRSKRNRAPK